MQAYRKKRRRNNLPEVKNNGLIDLAELEAAIRPITILISMMYANNEIGTIMPIKEISAIAKRKLCCYLLMPHRQ
jgi:cysteine sulfinate desulfinase/cysteine desulfurase-like protein